MPLPLFVGSGNIGRETSDPSLWSSKIYSPLVNFISTSSSPKSLFISLTPSAQQLIKYLDTIVSFPFEISNSLLSFFVILFVLKFNFKIPYGKWSVY